MCKVAQLSIAANTQHRSPSLFSDPGKRNLKHQIYEITGVELKRNNRNAEKITSQTD